MPLGPVSRLNAQGFHRWSAGLVEVSEEEIPINGGEDREESERQDDITDDDERTAWKLIEHAGAKELALGEDAQVGVIVVVRADRRAAFGAEPADFFLRSQTMI